MLLNHSSGNFFTDAVQTIRSAYEEEAENNNRPNKRQRLQPRNSLGTTNDDNCVVSMR